MCGLTPMPGLDAALASMFTQLISSPTFVGEVERMFTPTVPTALDTAKDILEAANKGAISITAARTALTAILDDYERKNTKSAEPSLDDLRIELSKRGLLR